MGVNTSKKVNNPNELIKNKSKLSCFLNSKLQRENIVFLKQLGLFYCYTWLKRDQLNRELLIVLKLQLQKESIRLPIENYVKILILFLVLKREIQASNISLNF